MVVVLAILAAFANAVASICQRLGVEDAPSSRGPSVGLVRHMVSRPIWLLGFAIMAAGYACQAVALHIGALEVVQPILVSELVMLVALLWLWFDTPVRARDFAAALATAGGLGAFLALASPRAGARVPSPTTWAVTGSVVCALAIGLTVAGATGPGWRRALILGAGASTGFALVAAVTKSLTDTIVHGWGATFSSWPLYVLAVVGLGSFVVMQHAFRVGPFAASQSTLILVNPFASLILGRVLFGEELRGGAGFVSLEVLSVLVMIVGVVGLSLSPLVADVRDEASGSHRLTGRGRLARRRSGAPIA
ncbi:MAG TPA: DMT family transporter [Acidimicrobiales bacterium]|nr:DMT family transporter [Acidimicrobiales bacterium]